MEAACRRSRQTPRRTKTNPRRVDMRLIDLLTSPWAIIPEKLLEIQAIYRTHLRGEKIDLGAIEARLGRPLSNDPKPYEVHKGVAVIEMGGIAATGVGLFTKISARGS